MARSRNRIGESGNIFFTLFGAVALVGIVGVATSTLMRGPMGTVITLNQKAKVDAQLQIARKLVGLASARAWQAAKAAGTACDNDAVIAPMVPDTSASCHGPAGGGCLPASIGAAKTDPWGTMVGYCAWDHGFNTDDCGLLEGETNLAQVGEHTVFAVISAGPDRKFETTCNDSPDYVTKGGDDIVFEWTYDEAAAGIGGGLWTLDSSQTARPDASVENLEISKPTTFASGATTNFNDSAAFSHGSRLDLGAGGIFNLPDQGSLADSQCLAVSAPTPPSPNDGILRRYTAGGGQVIQICDSLHGGWVDVGGSGAGGLAKGSEGDVQFNSGGDLYGSATFNFDKATNKLTLGPSTGTALDVKGDAAFSNDVTITRDLTVSDNLTVTKEAFFKEDVDFAKDIVSASGDVSIDDTLLVSGDSEFLKSLKVDETLHGVGDVTFDAKLSVAGDTTIGGDFQVSGTKTSTLTGDLNVNQDVDIDGDTNMDGQLLVNDKVAGASFEIGAIDSGEGMYSNGSGGLQLSTSSAKALEIDSSGDVGIGLSTGPTADLDIGGFMRLRGSGQVAGANCGAIPGAITYSSGDELLVCSNVTNNWETIGTSGGGGGGASDWWKKDTNILRYEHSSYIVDETNTLPVSGGGTRLIWYPTKAAFRVGSVGGSQWDDASIGANSMAFGQDVAASGANSTAFGKDGGVAGTNSFGVFMGGQTGSNITANNVFGLLGGKMVIDADGSQTAPHGALSLDVEGKVGATQYCSEQDNFCFTAEDVASGQLGAPGDEYEVIFHSGGVLGAHPGFVYYASGGQLGLNVPDATAMPTNLKANIIGDVGATQYCDEHGLNCFTAASVSGGALADPADDRQIFFNSAGTLENDVPFVYDVTGQVGIGTSAPSTTLHLKNPNAGLTLESGLGANESANIYFLKTGESAPKWVFGRTTWGGALADNLSIFEDDDPAKIRLTMTPGGNLGLRTTTPVATFDNAGSTALSGDIPGALTANTNDWAPANLATASVIRMTSTADVDLTGLAGGVDGRIISLMNVGTNKITLKPNAVGSAAANRFAMTGDLPLAADQTVILMYDATAGIWRHLANSTSMGSINVLAINDLTDAATDYPANNMFLGLGTGAAITTGTGNTALGSNALTLNDVGEDNVAIGRDVLKVNTGHANTAVGAAALANVTGGRNNTALGAYALNDIIDGIENVAIGISAGDSNAAGANIKNNNVFIGTRAGFGTTNASNNIMIGWQTGDQTTDGDSNILIGTSIQAPTPTTSSYLNIGGAFLGNMAAKSYAVDGSLEVKNAFSLSGDIPGALTANTNDWAPANLGTSTVIRASATAPVNLTGLAGGVDGRIMSIMNIGANAITLKNGDVASAAANRFALTGDLKLNTNQTVVLMYDSTANVWRQLANSMALGATAAAAGSTGQVQFNDAGALAADANFFWDNVLKRLGLGTATPTATLDVFGGLTTTKALIVRGNAVDDANIQEWQMHDGTPLAAITKEGFIDLNNQDVSQAVVNPSLRLNDWITGVNEAGGPYANGFLKWNTNRSFLNMVTDANTNSLISGGIRNEDYRRFSITGDGAIRMGGGAAVYDSLFQRLTGGGFNISSTLDGANLLSVTAAGTQTGDLVQLRSSAATTGDLLTVTGAGRLGLRTATPVATFDNAGSTAFSGDIPGALAANANDWAPANLATATVIRANASSAVNVTGLTGGVDGRILSILNVGANKVTLKNNDSASAVGNRFAFTGDLALGTNQTVVLMYDSTAQVWRQLANSMAMGSSATAAGVASEVQFRDTVTGTLDADAAFFYDKATHKLAVGGAAASTTLTVRPQATMDGMLLERLGNGSVNGSSWSVSVANAAADGAVGLGQTSATYTTGGPAAWAANDISFLYYPREFRIGTGLGAAPVMTMNSAGYVGIGTAAPLRALHVTQNGLSQLVLENTGTGGGYWSIGQSDNGFSAGGGKLVFVPDTFSTATAPVVFTNTGRVGIGNINPNASLDVGGSAALSGDIPGALTVNTNDWAPANLATASIIRANASAAVNVTGLTGGVDGRIITIMNTGANAITLKNADAASAAANRFAMTGDLILATNQNATFIYDSTSTVWRQVSNATAIGGGDNLGNHIATTNIQLGTNYLSGDGGNEGIRVDSTGKVAVGAATFGYAFNVAGDINLSGSVGSLFTNYFNTSQSTINSISSFRINLDHNADETGTFFKVSTNSAAAANAVGGTDLFMVTDTGVTEALGTFQFDGAIYGTGDISPAQLTANTNNWNPTGLAGASVIRMDANPAINLTGLAGGADGRIITLVNVGAQNITLKATSGSSTVGNQFALPGDVVLTPNQTVIMMYDATGTGIWRQLANSLASGTGDNLGNHIATQNIQLGSNWLSGDGGNEGINVNATGDVGIGLAAVTGLPLAVTRDGLNLAGTMYAVSQHDKADGTKGVLLGYDTTGTNVGAIYADKSAATASNLGFYTANASGNWSQRMFISSGGNVGIATSAPNTTLDINGSLAFSGDIPGVLAGNTDDWAPTNLATAAVIRASAPAAYNVTGLTGGVDGRFITIFNTGTFNITLKKDNGSASTAANRFALTADLVLTPNQNAILMYDATALRWRSVGSDGGTATAAGSNTHVQYNNNGILGGDAGFTYTTGTQTMTIGSGITFGSTTGAAAPIYSELWSQGTGDKIYYNTGTPQVGIGNTSPNYTLDVTGTANITGNVLLGGSIGITGDIPGTLTGNTNNWAPANLATATVIRADATSGAVDLTGLTGGSDGRVITILNTGANAITLKNNSGSSSAGNKFALPADVTLATNQSVVLMFDSTTNAWRQLANSLATSSGIGAIDDLTDASTDYANGNMRLGLNTALTTGVINGTFLGNNSGGTTTTGAADNNTAYGASTLSSLTTGPDNTAIGFEALKNNTTGSYNTAIGSTALKTNVGANNNVAVGSNAMGFGPNTGSNNTAVGTTSLFRNQGGGDNTALGNNTMSYNLTGNWNTAIGAGALFASTGNSNTAVGNSAGNLIVGVANTFLGQGAGSGTTGANVSYNTILGAGAGAGIDTGGSNNVLVGASAGSAITTGNNNIIIGYNAQALTATTNNQINIGGALYGNTSTGYVSPTSGFGLLGDIPGVLAANTNDWAPANLATAAVIRASSGAAYNLTGLTGGSDGRIVTIINTGTFAITLKNNDSGSVAANRFSLPADVTLTANQSIVLMYDSTASVWRQLANSLAAGTGDNLGNHIATTNIQLGTNYLSGDGGNEGILVSSTGEVGIGAASPNTQTKLYIDSAQDNYLLFGQGGTSYAKLGRADSNGATLSLFQGGVEQLHLDSRSGYSSWLPGAFELRGDITPTALAANTNDWNPANLATAAVIRVSASSAVDLTGLQGGADGRLLTLVNVGTFTITLKNNSGSSAAGNKFALPADVPLPGGQSVVLMYDDTVGVKAWRQLANSLASGTGDNLGNHTATTNIQLGTNYLSGDGGNEGIRVDASGNVGINSTAPGANLEIGAVVGVDSSFAMIDGDVVHGMTTVAPTNRWFGITELDSTRGGAVLDGFSDNANTTGMILQGTIGSSTPLATNAAIQLRGYKSNGTTGRAALNSGETVFGVYNGAAAAPAFQMTGNGFIGVNVAGAPVAGLDLNSSLAISSDITPTTLAANTNDWNPTGLSGAGVIRAAASAAYNLTGLMGGADGRIITIMNVGTFTITLKNNSGLSTAGNKFLLTGDLPLAAGQSAILMYDSSATPAAGWRQVANGVAAGGGDNLGNHVATQNLLWNVGAAATDNMMYLLSGSAGAVNGSMGFFAAGIGSSTSNDGPYFLGRGNNFSAIGSQRGNMYFSAGNPTTPTAGEGSIILMTGSDVPHMIISNNGHISFSSFLAANATNFGFAVDTYNDSSLITANNAGGIAATLYVGNSAASANGNGSSIGLTAAGSASSNTEFAGISMVVTDKTQATASGDLIFNTAGPNSSYLSGEKMRLTSTGQLNIQNALALQNDITPTTLGGNTDNWAPTNFAYASVIRMTSTGNVNLTGLAGGADGRVITLVNVDTVDTITLKNASTSSTVNNRFALTGDLALAPNQSVILIYDSVATPNPVWRQIANGTASGAAVAAAGSNTQIQYNNGGVLGASSGFTYDATAGASLFNLSGTHTGTAASVLSLGATTLTVAPTANQTAGHNEIAQSSNVVVGSGNTFTIRRLEGLDSNASNAGTGPVDAMQALTGWSQNTGNATIGYVIGGYAGGASSNGTVSSMSGLNAETYVTGGTVTDMYGVNIYMSQATGTVTNRYGLFISNPTGAATTKDFGIYQAGTQPNYLAGDLTVGETFVLEGDQGISLGGSNVNNAALTNFTKNSVFRLGSTAAIDLTGIAGGSDGRIIILQNTNASNAITLKNNSGSSSTGNKFLMNGDLALASNQTATFIYDTATASGVWRLVANGTAGGAVGTSIDALTDAVYNIGADHNMVLGSNTAPVTGAAGNIWIGEGAGKSTTNAADGNIALGYLALNANTTGSENMAIGTAAMNLATASTQNTAIGNLAMQLDASGAGNGNQNTAVGYKAMYGGSSGTNNSAFGHNAMGNGGTGGENTAIGASSMNSLTTGGGNIGIGYGSLLLNQTGNNNVAMGNFAVASITDDDSNVGVGFDALQNITTSNNTALGTNAGAGVTTGASILAIGFNALGGSGSGTGSNNVAIGDNAMGADTVTGGYNTAIGSGSLFRNTSGTNNVAVGDNTMVYSATGGFNTVVGSGALYANLAGSYNTAIGQGAGGYLRGSANVVIGSGTAVGAGDYTADNNTIIGSGSGAALATGGNANVILGFTSGTTITTGTNNILIGNSVQTPGATSTYALNIGDTIKGDLSTRYLTPTGGFGLISDISPAQITANQNDYNPTSLANAAVLRLNSNASRDITGLQGGSDGRIITIMNVGSFPIVLKNNSGSSTNGNKFLLTGDLTLAANQSAILMYDSSATPNAAWRQVANGTATGAGDNLGNHIATANIQLGANWLSGDGGNEGIFVDSTGRVGINTNSLTYDLTAAGTNKSTKIGIINNSSTAAQYPGIQITNYAGSVGGYADLALYTARGNSVTATAILQWDQVGQIEFQGHDGTGGTIEGADIAAGAAENWTNTAHGTYLAFRTVSNGTTGGQERLTIDGTGSVNVNYAFAVTGDIVGNLTASVDNWAPTNLADASTVRITSNGAYNVTGIAGGRDGRVLVLMNTSAYTITLKNNVTSTTGNRFLLTGDLALAPNQNAVLVYDSAASRWRSVGADGGNATAAGSNTQVQYNNSGALGADANFTWTSGTQTLGVGGSIQLGLTAGAAAPTLTGLWQQGTGDKIYYNAGTAPQVGIATTAPNAPLQIGVAASGDVTGATPSMIVSNAGSAVYPNILFVKPGSDTAMVGIDNGNYFSIASEGTLDGIKFKVNGTFGGHYLDSATLVPLTVKTTGVVDLANALTISGDIPGALATSTNDWAPANFATASVIRMTSTGNVNLTGLAGGADGRIITLINTDTTDTITLKNSVTSTATNQFLFTADVPLAVNESATLMYDSTSQRWRLLAKGSATGAGDNLGNHIATTNIQLGSNWLSGDGGAEGIQVSSIGNVGIGSAPWGSAGQLLTVQGADTSTTLNVVNGSSTTGRYPGVGVYNYTGGNGGASALTFYTGRGNITTTAAVQSGDFLGNISFQGNYNTSNGFGEGAYIASLSEGTFATNNFPANLIFYTNPAAGPVERLRIGANGLVSVAAGFALTGDTTPTALSGNTDNWAPANFATNSIIRASASAAYNLTGIAGGTDGRMISLMNVGTFAITLKNDVTSTAGNRFKLTGDLVLAPNQNAVLVYDATSPGYWRSVGADGGNATPGGSTTQVQYNNSGALAGDANFTWTTGTGTLGVSGGVLLGGTTGAAAPVSSTGLWTQGTGNKIYYNTGTPQVGIGLTAPAYSLDVTGMMHVTPTDTGGRGLILDKYSSTEGGEVTWNDNTASWVNDVASGVFRINQMGANLGAFVMTPLKIDTAGTVVLNSAVALGGRINATIAANTNNWAPANLSTASIIRASSTTGPFDITGLTGGLDGRVITIMNVGTGVLTLKNNSGSSSAANRFAFTGDLALAVNQSAVLVYDSTASLWRQVSNGTATGSGDNLGNHTMTSNLNTNSKWISGDGTDGGIFIDPTRQSIGFGPSFLASQLGTGGPKFLFDAVGLDNTYAEAFVFNKDHDTNNAHPFVFFDVGGISSDPAGAMYNGMILQGPGYTNPVGGANAYPSLYIYGEVNSATAPTTTRKWVISSTNDGDANSYMALVLNQGNADRITMDWNGVTNINTAFALPGDINATVAAATNNWAPSGLSAASVIRATVTGANRDVTGLTGGARGRFITIQNVGASNNLTLKNSSASSSAANRFLTGTDVIIAPNQTATLMYDSTVGITAWRLVAYGSASGTGDNLGNHIATANIQLGSNYLSGDGGNEGVSVDSAGKVTVSSSIKFTPVTGSAPSGIKLTDLSDVTVSSPATNDVLKWNGSAWVNGTGGGGGGTPGGSNTQLQFNNSGAFAGSANMTWDGTTMSVAHSAASATSGILGTTSSVTTNASAIKGVASGTTGTTYGVYGTNASVSGYGVYGLNTGSTGGIAVTGESNNTNGIGVQGYTNGTAGTGVLGFANASTGVTAGVFAKINSTTAGAAGVYAQSLGSTGANYGVYGSNASATGFGGYFTNSNGGVALYANGDIQYTGTITDVSDMRLKKDITPLNTDEMVRKLAMINTYTFRMKDSANDQLEYGVMAQEVEKVFPDLVKTAKDEFGTKSVNYMGFIAPLIETTKSLKAENDNLKDQLAQLETDREDTKQALADMRKEINGMKAYTGYGTSRAEMGVGMLLGMGATISLLFAFGGIIRIRRRDSK